MTMKNKQTDLNDHLFAQLERLGDEDLKGEELEAEIERSRAITNVAKHLISSGALALQAQVKLEDGLIRKKPEFFLENKNGNDKN